MSVEELRAGLARLAEPVVPAGDPYGRLLRRARRSRRLRLAGRGSALAAALVAALLAPLLVQSSGNPHPAPLPGVDDLNGADITPWVQRLLDTPTRGNLAADGAFISALDDRLEPGLFGFSPELSQRTVLFAGDVGTYRAVLVAFHSDARQMGVWLVADAGASASRLADAAANNASAAQASPAASLGTTVLPEELQPFSATAVSDPATNRCLALGLAPEGCRVATKDGTHPQTWHDEATVDYVARTDRQAASLSTFARVTCDGVVRFQAPVTDNARVELGTLTPTEQQVGAALVGARGTPPSRTLVRQSLTGMSESAVSFDACRVLYAGPIPGSVDSSPVPGGVVRRPPVLVTACTTAHGNTMFEVTAEDGGGSGSGGYSRVKLTDPHAIIAVRGLRVEETANTGSSMEDDGVLVLAPGAATLLQVVQAGQVVQSIPLSAGIGSITVPIGATAQLRAVDAAGAVVGSGVGPAGEVIPEEQPKPVDTIIRNWS